jgi:LysM repeat protein
LAQKICPICGAVNHPNATMCPTCGTSLSGVQTEAAKQPKSARPAHYDRRFGETDLFEGEVRRSPELVLTIIGGAALVVLCVAALIVALPALNSATAAATPTEDAAALTGGTPTSDAILITNTVRPTMAMATVTPAPPTATPPPTEGPCEYTVQPGDDLITLAYRCGHRSLDIVPEILTLNDLSAPEAIQVGQTLLIPRPTPTADPAAQAVPATQEGDTAGEGVAALFVIEANATPPTATLFPTPTLLPGIQWHIVQPQESMVSIMYQYNTSAEVLSQINPEVPFSQCDFQYDTGGPSCMVLLQPGQQLRVPAPTPTPTLSPTPSGSETATPTATATFNAPSLISPNDRARFSADEIVTLRWVTTGVLGPGDAYRVQVEDLTAGQSYSADTGELFFILPSGWQGQDGRPHEFRWSIGLVPAGTDQLRYETPARTFIWNSRQGTGS